jgi:hypothetical protein
MQHDLMTYKGLHLFQVGYNREVDYTSEEDGLAGLNPRTLKLIRINKYR